MAINRTFPQNLSWCPWQRGRRLLHGYLARAAWGLCWPWLGAHMAGRSRHDARLLMCERAGARACHNDHLQATKKQITLGISWGKEEPPDLFFLPPTRTWRKICRIKSADVSKFVSLRTMCLCEFMHPCLCSAVDPDRGKRARNHQSPPVSRCTMRK